MFSFSEDMLPRHFPKIHLPKAKPLDETTSAVIPQPTLPSVSLMFSNEMSCTPQQSIQKWKVQHQAKSSKKHVRFAAIDRGMPNERNGSFDIRSNSELSFSDEKDHLQRPCQIKTNIADKMTNHSPLETKFWKYNRFQSSNVMKENSNSRPLSLFPRGYQLQGNVQGTLTHSEATNVGQRSPSCTEIMLNILEEQQLHISIQQNQLLVQEKQSLEQQKQICMLEYRIQQLLLQNEANCIEPHQSLNDCEFGDEVMDDKNSTNCGLVELVPDVVGSSGSIPKRFRLNEEAKNSGFFYYKIDEILSSYPRSHINVTTQTSICETTTLSSSAGNSKIVTDRSFVLNMLEVKYKRSEKHPLQVANRQCSYNKNGSSDRDDYQFPDNEVPSDMYDYLVRHGLINRKL